ncbi:MAG: hypothetical protein ACT4O1_02625 [Gemmatimonadota bacterium]
MKPQIWYWLLPLLLAVMAGVMVLRRRRLHGRRLYQQQLERALADGILTEAEAQELATVREKRDLSDAEVRMVAVSLYRRALKEAVEDARITEHEHETLERLRTQLALSDADLAADVQQMQRIRLFAGVERGELPRIEPPLEVADGEVCHWAAHARLAEQLVAPGRKTGLRAVNFAVAGTAPFSAAGERGALGPSSEILPVDLGLMVVTNRRTIFRGARKHLSVPHMKLRTLDLFKDGVALDETDPAQSSFFLVSDPELTAAILLSAARTRQQELKNLTTRSA